MPCARLAASRRLSASIAARVQTNAKIRDPSRWALLVVDLQNDFLDKGGYYGRRTVLQQRADWAALSSEEQLRLLDGAAQARPSGALSRAVEQVVAQVCKAIAAARAAGQPIAFIRAVYDRGLEPLPPFLAKDPARRHYPCKPGGWGTAFFGAIADAVTRMRPSERIVEKHTYDAFTNPTLAAFLEEMRCGAVVVCGTETQVCVLSTAQHAALLGFRAFILDDCVWSPNDATAGAALSIFRDAFGATLTVGDLAALGRAPEADRARKAGFPRKTKR
jgi:nicotinamidase-related amidase